MTSSFMASMRMEFDGGCTEEGQRKLRERYSIGEFAPPKPRVRNRKTPRKAARDEPISPITSASKSAPSGSEPSAARDHRNCAVCGKPSKLGDLVGWVLDQDSRLRFCPDCQQTKETGQ